MSVQSPQRAAATAAVNDVRVVGRLSEAPERKELPSGDVLVSFRVVVERPPESVRGRQRVDVLDCAVWSGRPRRTVSGWAADDVVEVCGSVRRRFYRTASGTASRVEIEVRSARLIRRSASA
jgi:single-strand DNA-binding protein